MKVRLVRVFAVVTMICVVALWSLDVLTVVDTLPAAIPGIIFQSLALAGFALVGVMIVIRRPENGIGTFFCASAMIWALSSFSLEYATLWTDHATRDAASSQSPWGHW